jgi:hypothetical protein
MTKKLALIVVLLGGLVARLPALAQRREHKVEHNNCRMRGSEPDVEASSPTVSALLRVRAARMIHLLNRCTG